MKICLYTISNFTKKAIDCIDLLLDSITKDIEFDFFIITNQKDIPTTIKHNILLDNTLSSNYVGYLKYSKVLPNNYEYYIYLDSDILFFDSLSKLIPYNRSFTVVRENTLIERNFWYYFPFVEKNDDEQLQTSQALNAGTFAFHKNQIHIIDKILSLYSKHHTNEPQDPALEQSIFNYVVNKNFQYKLYDCLDITDTVQLFASTEKIHKNKKLYHFCGYTNEMDSKYKKMHDFYSIYRKII